MRLKVVKDTLKKRLAQLREPSNLMRSFWQREMYPFYQKKQIERWQTEGKSEGFAFPKLKPQTVKRKERQKERDPAKYPGGRKKLVHEGTLVSSVVGPIESSEFSPRGKEYHRKMITPKKFKVSTTIPYGLFVIDWMRSKGSKSFMKFGEKTHGEMRSMIKSYLVREFVR